MSSKGIISEAIAQDRLVGKEDGNGRGLMGW